METTNYFLELQKIECEVEKKNGLNYISWSDGWEELKKVHPEATYRKVKNGETYLFKSGTGGSVECEVTVGNITHCADLAITDFKNQEIKYESIKSTDIQNTLQRAFAKAIAMHGIGLYVYRGEDFPEDDDGQKANEAPRTKTEEKRWFNFPDLELAIKEGFDTDIALRQYIKDFGFTCSAHMGEVIKKYLTTGELTKPEFKK